MLKKRLDLEHTLIYTDIYPSKYSYKKYKNIAILGIGGNIGDTIRRFERVFFLLKRDKRVHITKVSPILKNPPFGYTNQDYFYNAILEVQTNMTHIELLDFILRVEDKFGRKRPFKDAPRTLDIDMIFFNNLTINTKRLILPHKDYINRASVLIPLSYIKRR
jgi:2-amino-4-hydroxy-6-hydroxymethyldihydropteridine diphosphokinase